MSSRPVRHNKTCFYYRPQKKFAKAMFLHVSVSHSVHMGRGGIQVCLVGLQAHVQGGLEVWPGESPDPHPGRKLRGRGGSLGPHPGGKLRGRGVSRPTPMGEVEGLAWVGVSRPTPGVVYPSMH